MAASSTTPSSPLRTPRLGTPRVINVFGLPTPPESPVEDIIPKTGHHQFAASGPVAVIVDNIAYPTGQIRVMAEEISQARSRGEFPQSTSSPMDAQFVVEDYGYLCELRSFHKDLSRPAPEEYHRFRIEITRRIKERDDALDEESNKEEAARRVGSYMRSVDQECKYFDAASTVLEKRGVKNPTQLDLDNVSEEILSIVEHVVEHTMADASAPLRMNIGKLNNQAADFQDQNDTYSRQLDLHYRNIEQHSAQCSDTISALNSLFEPQAEAVRALNALFGTQAQTLQTMNSTLAAQTKNTQAMESNLAVQTKNTKALNSTLSAQTKNTQATAESLLLANSLAKSLSQLVVNLPDAINQVVSTAVQYQAREAIKDVMNAQQQAILSVQEHLRQERSTMETHTPNMLRVHGQDLDIDALIESIVKSKQERESSNSRTKGKLRHMMHKIFKRVS